MKWERILLIQKENIFIKNSNSNQYIRQTMKFKSRTIRELAQMICGDFKLEESFFQYRSSSKLTEFFQDCDTEYKHDGTSRKPWVGNVLEEIIAEPQTDTHTPSETFIKVIQVLMDKNDGLNENFERKNALQYLNTALARDDFEAFYAPDTKCYLRHIKTDTVAMPALNPHRPFSEAELAKRNKLNDYLNIASEDDLIEKILLPLFRQIRFQRVSVTGHKDKALEYGKDLWMKFVLPTMHVLYFGIQVKKDKLDAAGMSKSSNKNVAEVYNQALMMLGHEIFDPETNKRVLVDHAFIIAGGEITKAAKNWIGNKLDVTQRSQIMFMDRDDILNLFVASNLSVPSDASNKAEASNDQ